MEDVAIVGAGELGGLIADVLARREIVHTIRLVDDDGAVAAGKALDIMQAAPVHGFATRLLGSTDFTSIASAGLIVLADRFKGGEWQGDDGLLTLKRIVGFASNRPIVCSGASQRELIERGVRELCVRRRYLFGSAPEAFAAALRAIVALEGNQSPKDVALMVLGVPPDNAVIPWDDVTIGGFSAISLLDEPTRRRIAAKAPLLWPPGPYALAVAAAETIAVIFGRSRKTLSCFVAPDDSGGRRTRAAALPVRVGPTGILKVEMPTLAANARVALDNAMQL